SYDFIERVHRHRVNGLIWIEPDITHRPNLMRLVDIGMDVVTTGPRFPDLPIRTVHEDFHDLALKIATYCRDQEVGSLVYLGGALTDKFGSVPDQNTIDIVEQLQSTCAARGITFNPDHVCQAYGDPEGATVVSAFLRQYANTNAIVCQHLELLGPLQHLQKDGLWPYPEQMTLIDLTGTFAEPPPGVSPLPVARLGRIPVTRMCPPTAQINLAAVLELERIWQETGTEKDIDLSVGLVAPNGDLWQPRNKEIL
ncbi:MAG: hypothetical protein JXA42_08655, partial [Anaerolineales bacterium]|nr:hypothetical protein [Anaerolineales bacterium]